MLIGLTGTKNSGKDTVAAYLVKKHGFERKAFAHPLKQSVAGLFDLEYHQIELYKRMPLVHVMLTVDGKISRDMTFREFLQKYGTEAHRDIEGFGENTWIDITLPVTGFYYTGRKIVISDVRFENEAYRVHAVGGAVARIIREAPVDQDLHRSEQGGFPVDYQLANYGKLDDLYDGIEKMLVDLGSYQRGAIER